MSEASDAVGGIGRTRRGARTPAPAAVGVAAHRDGPLLVTGAPGSGLTTALVDRLRRLLADPAGGRVLVLAAAGAAAGRLERRVERAIGDRGHAGVDVMTYTAAALELVRSGAQAVGVDQFTEVATAADRLALLLDRIDELPLRHHDIGGRPAVMLGGVVARVDRIKRAGISAADVTAWADGLPDDDPSSAREREFARIMAAHDRMLTAAGLLDPGETVLLAQHLLERREDVAARTARRWPHLLVDDIDEAGRAQLRLVELLVAPHGDLVATIARRAGREAGQDRMLESLLTHGVGGHRASKLDLGATRRLPPQVASAAGLASAAGAIDGAVEAWRCATERAQAQAVASRASELVASGSDADAIAVLVPSVRRDGQRIASALAERGIPHRLSGAAALLGQAEVRDVLAWLRLLVDPSDASAAVRALTRPPIALHSVDVARSLQIARRRRLDMPRGLTAATESSQLPPEAQERIVIFLRHYQQAVAALDTTRPDLFVHRLIDDLGMRRRHVFATRLDVVERLRGLSGLEEMASGYARRAPQATARDFARWLASLADVGPGGAEDEQSEHGHGVAVLEFDAVAGREWDHVVICGLSAAQMEGRHAGRTVDVPAELLGEPEPDGSDDGAPGGQTEEANRLLASGITRAARTLVLSYAAEGPGEVERSPAAAAEQARDRAGVEWIDVGERLSDEEETLRAAFTELRDELLLDVQRIGARLGELRLDTDLDVAHGTTRYLELLKLAALLARPEGRRIEEMLPVVSGAIEQASTSLQKEILRTSSLDDLLRGAERGAALRAREAAAIARPEPSLEPFLPRRGDGLALSASDIETYRTCPLKYKFARVLRVRQEPTVNQRFGIVVHQVLERYHQDADPHSPSRPARPRSLESLLGLLESSWRRAGFGHQVDEEVQLWHKAEQALRRYHERFHAETGEPLWFERSFTFAHGRHTLRGRVDRVDRTGDGGYELIDYKTGRPRTEEQLRDDVQLSLYALAARRAWDLPESRQSYYYVLDDLRVPLPESPGGESWIAEIVDEVAAGIEAQNFEPTPSFAACSICDHRIACPAAEL